MRPAELDHAKWTACMVDLATQSDEALAAEAAREGSDGPAFAEIVRRYQDRVWRVCYRLLGNEADAHDAAQEVLVKLFTCRGQFAGRSKYSTWLHGIAIRTSLAMRRSRSRRQRRVDTVGEEMLERSGGGATENPAALNIDLMQMLEVLDEEDRAMIILKYAENYSHDELAELFGLSTSACKMRISRARSQLKQRFPEAS